MKISVGLPTHRVDRQAEFVTAEAIAEMAQAAERAGFDAVYVTEHPFPYDPWFRSGGHHALDPFVALAFAAAATTSLRLQTHLCVVPYRNPFLTAKAVASLDVLSGGRVILGVATGYLEEEFAALGVDFSERNLLMDEALEAMKLAWTGETVTLSGRHFHAPGNAMLPRPTQRPHPPIWVGGNSREAIRRAVDHADGWAPMPNPAQSAARRRSPALETVDDLRGRIDYARSYAVDKGRSAPLTVACALGGLDGAGGEWVDVAGQLGAAGVTYLYFGIGEVDTRSEYVEKVAALGSTLIPEISAL
jgi:probable F420-dependent oxidoreductase